MAESGSFRPPSCAFGQNGGEMAPGRRAFRRKAKAHGALMIAGALAVVATAGVTRWLHEWPVHHFGVVVPGALYRSAQPRGDQWATLAGRYGIRTVIDLREDEPRAGWQVEEASFCRRNGIRHVKLPIGPRRLTEGELRQVLALATDPSCRPVLVHCEHGSSRTGVVVAAYRMLVQGWHLEAALADSYRYRRPMNAGYTSYLRQLASGEGLPGVGDRRGRRDAHLRRRAYGPACLRPQEHGVPGAGCPREGGEGRARVLSRQAPVLLRPVRRAGGGEALQPRRGGGLRGPRPAGAVRTASALPWWRACPPFAGWRAGSGGRWASWVRTASSCS